MDYNINEYNQIEYHPTAEEIKQLKKRERKGIFSIGLIAGSSIVGYVILNNLLSLPIILNKNLYEIYETNPIVTYSVSIFMSAFCLLVPFLLGGALLKKKTKIKYKFFKKPDDTILSIYAIPMGVFACVAGNYLTSVFVYLMKIVGFKLTSPDFSAPDTIPGRIIYIIAIAIVPPIVEEIAMRGCIMQPLRKYGDRFAIVMTAFLFAILHGNLIQAPFAFIAGIAFGYITCITGSLIPSMIVHFINNLYSVAVEFMNADIENDELVVTIYTTTELVLITIGVVAAIFFVFRLNHRTTRNPASTLTPAAKTAAFLFNPSMLIAIAIMIYITSNYVSYSSVF